MKEVAAADPGQEDDDLEEASDVSAGYHSDSDSAVMASGNSPFVSKSARYHFLSRSGESCLHYTSSVNVQMFASFLLNALLIAYHDDKDRRYYQNGRATFFVSFLTCPRRVMRLTLFIA